GALSGFAVSSSNSKVYTATFTADGTSAISISSAASAFTDVAGNASTAGASPSIGLTYSVIASDAYASGSTVYLDVNANGAYDAGTDILATESTTTAGTYTFTVPKGQSTSGAQIVTSGGYDTVSDGAVGTMTASFGQTVVSAISTLYAAATTDAAKAAVLTSYGLTAYSDTDPYAALSSTSATTAATAQATLVKNQVSLAVVTNINTIVPLFLTKLGVSKTALEVQNQINKEIAALTLSAPSTAANLYSTTTTSAATSIQTVFDKVMTAFGVTNAAQYAAASGAAATAIASVSANLAQFASSTTNLALLKSGGNAAVQQTGSDALASDLGTFINAYFAATTDAAKTLLVTNLNSTYSSSTM
ncbi:MAG: hypothetical protein JZU63_00320, partial [Rhodoferax sp.]|nr:hypothetical protein [Rhodoferax sp.]